LVSGNVALSTAQFIAETKSLRYAQTASLAIPVGSMSRIYTANVSDNMQWLAVSSKTRGALWDLNTGQRKLHVRGFRGALVAANGTAIGDFPKLEPENHSLVLLDGRTSGVNVVREIPERGARQYGRLMLVRKSNTMWTETNSNPDSSEASEDAEGNEP